MKKVIVSLGGSVVCPKRVDTNFLKRLKNIVYKEDYQFVLYCGGGYRARRWQRIASFFGLRRRALDWIGIFATRRNAAVVKNILKKDIHEKIIINPTGKIDFREKVLIAAGWKPGWSTDYDAVLLAENLGVNTIINMSNIDYAYDKDPKRYKDAKPIKKISWKKFRKIVGDKWKPGLNMPFDPIASKKAAELKLKVIIAGKNLNNFKGILRNKKFKGTLVN